MAQIATTIPPKGLGAIHLSDFWKSLLLAALMNVLLALYPIVSSGNWPTHTDLVLMLKSTVAVILAYFIKNFSTNNVGEILEKDKPIVHVDAADLKQLEEKAAEAEPK